MNALAVSSGTTATRPNDGTLRDRECGRTKRDLQAQTTHTGHGELQARQ
jgi:hypothetical protein